MLLKTPKFMLKIKHEVWIDRRKKQKLNLTPAYFLV